MKGKKAEYISFRTTTEVKEELEKIAKKEDRTISWIIDQAVKEYLCKREKEGE